MSDEFDHQRLATARRDAGFTTASDAARYFGWNENTYRSHENGERGLKKAVALKYAQAFSVSVDYLLFGTPFPKEEIGKSNRIPVIGMLNCSNLVDMNLSYFKNFEHELTAYVGSEFTNNFFAVQIPTESYYNGVLGGSLLICFSSQSDVSESIQKLCIVLNEDGLMYLSPIISMDEVSAIYITNSSFELKKATPKAIWQVHMIIPPNQWSLYRRKSKT